MSVPRNTNNVVHSDRNITALGTKDSDTQPRRAVRPCDGCRRRKTRCNFLSNEQNCTACIQRNAKCHFVERPPDRSLKRRRIGASDPENEQGNTQFVDSPLVQPLLAEQPPGSIGSHILDNSDIALTSSTPRARTATPGLDDREQSLGQATGRFAELYGLTSDMEPILMRHRPYDSDNHEFRLETHSIRRVLEKDDSMEYPVCFHVVVDDRSQAYDSRQTDSDEIERIVSPFGKRLIRLFFNIVHPSYPVCFKDGFLDAYGKGYRNVDASLLGAIYLMALSWWDYDSYLSTRKRPDSGPLRRLVIQALQTSYHRPRLASVGAALLLLQCKPEDPLNPDHTYTRSLVQQTLGIAEAVGLHLDSSSWSIPYWERRQRVRLSWAMYLQDKWTALAYGRPSHIREDNWAVKPLTSSDLEFHGIGAEALVDENNATSSFLEMTKLTGIMSEIIQEFFTLTRATNQDTVDLYYKSLPMLQRIDLWVSSLPDALKADAQSIQQLCPSGYLHLAYHGVKLSLFRRLIRSTALAPLCLDVFVLGETRRLASQAAQEATAFVSSLRADHLEAFWFFSSPFVFSLIGSFITLLLVTSRTEIERSHWRDHLGRYLWTLRLMSKASEPMRYAVNRLEGAILKGLEHALAVDLDGRPVLNRPDPSYGPEFDFVSFGNIDDLHLDAFDLLSGMDLGNFQGDMF